ncbi:MAG: CapA family protein, partial [bacterium]
SNEKVPQAAPEFRQLIDSADCIIGNLEAPIVQTQESKKRILSTALQFSLEYLREILEVLNLSHEKLIVSLANNHIGDHGEMGLLTTLDFLEKLQVRHIGIIQPGDALPVFQHGELRFGIFAWTQWMNREAFQEPPRPNRREDLHNKDWQSIKKKNRIHTLIGMPHWQYEFRHFPNQQARSWVGEMVEAGFDLLVSHHPHVPGPAERIQHTFCHYTLGNLIGVHLSWPTKIAGVLEVHIVNQGVNIGKVAFLQMHPFYLHEKNRQKILLPFDQLPNGLRKKCQKRWDLLYPSK